MRKKKILLIYPYVEGGFASIWVFQLPAMALYFLANITPLEYEVDIRDERNHRINFSEYDEKQPDLVAITVVTPTANRSYELADWFTKKGSKVLLGGVHVSMCPNEAMEHGHVVVGEVTNESWQMILSDYERNDLKPLYEFPIPASIEFTKYRDITPQPPFPWFLRLLLNAAGGAFFLQVQRGCPINCSFCSVSRFNGKVVGHRDVDSIISDIKNSGSKLIVFVDDNIVADKRYALELFEQLRTLNISWISQTDVRIALDDELFNAALASGMLAVFLGLESPFGDSLTTISSVKKVWSREYETAIQRLKSNGIAVEGAFIVGLPGDTVGTLHEIVSWAEIQRLDVVQIAIATPFPGTRLYDEMSASGDIIDFDWSHYNIFRSVTRQSGFESPQQLEELVLNAYRNFYTIPKALFRFGSSIINYFRYRVKKQFSRYVLMQIIFLIANLQFRELPRH